MQSGINNSIAVSIEKTLNEVVYGFTPVRSADLAMPTEPDNPITPILVRKEAADAIVFAQLNGKTYYDRKHQGLSMKASDFALFRLHKEYQIPSSARLGRKLSQQYVGLFKVLIKVGNLAYHLDLPAS